MKVLKYILFTVLGLIVLELVIAAFIPTHYKVTKDITINQPLEEVFDYVVLLKNQDNYSKWALMDPNMDKTYEGVDGTVGFVSAWASENKDVGAGEQEIMKVQDNYRIDYELRFLKPFEATEPAYMMTEAISDNETRVTWSFEGHMDYPMNIFIPIMGIEEMIANDLDEGLAKLKVILEE